MPCKYYPVQFQEEQIRVLLDIGSEINAMNFEFTQKLGRKVQKINVGAQKINGSTLETFEMVIANLQVEDKVDRPRFFQKTFLVADTKYEIILEIFFLKFSNANVSFGKKTLI